MKTFTQGGWRWENEEDDPDSGMWIGLVIGLTIVVYTGACLWLAALAWRMATGGG